MEVYFVVEQLQPKLPQLYRIIHLFVEQLLFIVESNPGQVRFEDF